MSVDHNSKLIHHVLVNLLTDRLNDLIVIYKRANNGLLEDIYAHHEFIDARINLAHCVIDVIKQPSFSPQLSGEDDTHYHLAWNCIFDHLPVKKRN